MCGSFLAAALLLRIGVAGGVFCASLSFRGDVGKRDGVRAWAGKRRRWRPGVGGGGESGGGGSVEDAAFSSWALPGFPLSGDVNTPFPSIL